MRMQGSLGRNVVLVLCIMVAACSARSGGRTAVADLDVITTAEMDGSGHADAYSLVQSLRPQWLRVRGTSSVNGVDFVRVYLDGSMLGGAEYLRQISTHSIASLRYMDGLEASQRWGLDHGAGAIMVSSLRRTPQRPDCCAWR